MLFNVEADRGNQIVGYLVPDDFTQSPTLRVVEQGHCIIELKCEEERPSLVVAGRHATGRCGFTIDETLVPNLQGNDKIELLDAETGILIYRRRKSDEVTNRRVFRLETHLFPLWRLDQKAEHRFQFFHKGVERHGRETALQVLQLANAKSVYVSGRLAFKSYENFLHDQFSCVTLLREPFRELAERLMTLKYVAKFGDELLGPRDMVYYSEAIAFASTVEAKEDVLQKAFDSITRQAIGTLANPLTRQLASDSLDEPPPKGAMARALSSLSSFAIVGLHERLDVFLQDFEALLEVPAGSMPPPSYFSKIEELTEVLRRTPEAEMLLEQDLELYSTVRSVIEEAV